MSDLISREAAIKAIERNAYRHTYIDQILDIIKSMPSAHPLDPCETCLHKGKGWDEDPCDGCTGTESKYEPYNGWIPLSERLPECGRNILAWVLDGRDGHMTVARFDDGKAYWSYMNRNYYPKGEIIAWMPLPEPYEEEA